MTKLNAEHIADIVKEDSIAIIWNIYDVFSQAEDRGIECSNKEARGILQLMDRKHDANNGITWDTIDYHLDELVRGRTT